MHTTFQTGTGPPYKNIVYEEHDQGKIILIAFNRPDKYNCINTATHRELIHAWDRFRTCTTARVAIMTGQGTEAFCAGGDLTDPMVCPVQEEDVAMHNRGEARGIIGPTRMTECYKPVIAAVNGVAYAGGFEWSMIADIRIAEEHASFGVTCRRWNVGLGDGGTQRLPRLIGQSLASELILTGRVIDAVEAHRIGLVNRPIVPRGQSRTAALALARELCALPQTAMRSDLEALKRGMGMELKEGLKVEAQCFNRSFLDKGGETMEGLRRFQERDHHDRVKGGAGKGSGTGVVRRQSKL
ncbi:BQ2448_5576 [Microbotryum intermedium]|uniref:BQ2448_5576 protein n=1 Tax=Microbotryum intermedium TaxID=269621 RepID=A0A238EYG3_9BASI|nr:BQ2448_5576 [Microbotryum intermedium]